LIRLKKEVKMCAKIKLMDYEEALREAEKRKKQSKARYMLKNEKEGTLRAEHGYPKVFLSGEEAQDYLDYFELKGFEVIEVTSVKQD
jgi:hypothetical protein